MSDNSDNFRQFPPILPFSGNENLFDPLSEIVVIV